MPDESEEQVAPPAGSTSEEAPYSSTSHPYGHVAQRSGSQNIAPPTPAQLATRRPPPAPPPAPAGDDEEGDEERGMLRMSFLEHLEELRSRIIKAALGLVVAFCASLFFTTQLWNIVSAPAVNALKHLGINPPHLVAITPMEQFNIIWLKLPLLVAIFLGSPWIVYQAWAFISPGLYRREKRWAAPFIICTAGLFIVGGVFAYFVVFRYGLEFLLGIGRNANVTPMVSINEYFDLFVNVTLGVGLVFEMPVIILFLTVLRLASPRFLLRHSRYAILAIVILGAVVTPTPDALNMTIVTVPMILLFFLGVFASYLVVLHREGKKFPWGKVLLVTAIAVVLIAGSIALLVYRYHYHLIYKWPFLMR